MTPAQRARLSVEELAAWEACEAATKGPWTTDDPVNPHMTTRPADNDGSFNYLGGDYGTEEDWAFIRRARTSLPAALETIANLREDLATEQTRHTRAWEALCRIGSACDSAGHYTLIPERALRVGEAVDALIAERDALRADLARVTQERDYLHSISEKP